MQELAKKIILLTQYNQSLEKQLKAKKTELTVVQKHHDVIDEFESMKQKLENANKEYFMAMNRVTFMGDEIERLKEIQKKFKILQVQHAKLKEDHQALLSTSTANEQHIKELTQTNETLLAEKSEMILKETTIFNEIAKLKEDHQKLLLTNTANQEKILELTQVNNALLVEKDELIVKEATSLKQHTKLKDDHQKLFLTNTINEKKIIELTHTNQTLLANKDEFLLKEATSLKSLTRKYDVQLQNHLKIIEQQKIKIYQLEQKLEKMNQKHVLELKQVEKSKKELLQELQEVKKSKQKFSEEEQNLKRQLKSLNEKVQELDQNIIEEKALLQQQKQKNREAFLKLSHERQIMQLKEENHTKENANLKKELEKQQERIKQLEKSMKEMKQSQFKNLDFDPKKDKLEREIEQLKEKLDTKRSEIQNWKKDAQNSEEKIRELKKVIQQHKQNNPEEKIKKLENQILILSQQQKQKAPSIIENQKLSIQQKNLKSLEQIVEDQKKLISEQNQKMTFISELLISKQNEIQSFENSTQLLKRQLADALKDVEKVRKQLVTKRAVNGRGFAANTFLGDKKDLDVRKSSLYMNKSQAFFSRYGNQTSKARMENRRSVHFPSNNTINGDKTELTFDPEQSISQIDVVHES